MMTNLLKGRFFCFMGRINGEYTNGRGQAAAGFRVEVPSVIRVEGETVSVNGTALPVSLGRFREDNDVAFASNTIIQRSINNTDGEPETAYTICGPEPRGEYPTTGGLVFSAIPDSALQNAYLRSNKDLLVDDYFGDLAAEKEGPQPEKPEPVKRKKPRWAKKTTDSLDL